MEELFRDRSHQELVECILESYRLSFGRDLLPMEQTTDGETAARALFYNRMIVLAHDRICTGNQFDNRFTYANKLGLVSFESTWEAMTAEPSTKSAVAASQVQDDRNRLLQRTILCGPQPIRDVSRMSTKGREILLQKGELFNLSDRRGIYRGQCAVVSEYVSK